MIRKTFLAAAAAVTGLLGASVQAVPAIVATTPYGGTQATPGTVYYGQPAPPAAQYEPTPAPRAGYTWAPGFYEWRGNGYAWTPGRWIEHRQGWAWQQPRWEQRADGSWHMTGGQWVRTDTYSQYEENPTRAYGRRFGPNGDLDGDGVLNREDRDRDGDGVRNRDDDFPNDPTRN